MEVSSQLLTGLISASGSLLLAATPCGQKSLPCVTSSGRQIYIQFSPTTPLMLSWDRECSPVAAFARSPNLSYNPCSACSYFPLWSYRNCDKSECTVTIIDLQSKSLPSSSTRGVEIKAIGHHRQRSRWVASSRKVVAWLLTEGRDGEWCI